MPVCLFEQISDAEVAFREVSSRVLKIDGRRFLLLYHGQKWYLTQPDCPHAGASLAAGHVYAGELICPMHAYSFDLRSGEESYKRCAPLKLWRVYHYAGGLWADIHANP